MGTLIYIFSMQLHSHTCTRHSILSIRVRVLLPLSFWPSAMDVRGVTGPNGCLSNETAYEVYALPLQSHYAGPDMQDANPCQCNTVVFSLLAECGLCQNRTTSMSVHAYIYVEHYSRKHSPGGASGRSTVPRLPLAGKNLDYCIFLCCDVLTASQSQSPLAYTFRGGPT
jgi:hypothetical protein